MSLAPWTLAAGLAKPIGTTSATGAGTDVQGTNSISLTEALGHWHDFYALAGEASATMVGLLFVAASVSSGAFSTTRRAAQRVFLSASVVNFSSVLAACMVVLSPLGTGPFLGAAIVACALFGLSHSALALRDTLRDGLIAKIDLEDRTWYLVMPILGYVIEATSGTILALQRDEGCPALALSVGLLLLVGIHNAWDITIWSITRRRE
jgi:hypothetical protein